jgi:hypothetical protein
MKPTVRQPWAGFPLLIGFVAAVALHALLLAYHQLRQSRSIPPALLPSRDNTPELLQFSRQPAPLTTLEVLPLPKASLLPPPPSPEVLAPLGPSRGRLGTGADTPRSSKKPRVGQGKRAPKVALKQRKLGSQPQNSTGLAPRLETSDWAPAVEQLRAFVELHRGSPQDGKANAQTFSELDPAQQEAYQKLWNLAQPLQLPSEPSTEDGTKLAIELRELPLQQSRADDLQIGHRQIVVLKGEILLFWLDGQQLWILRSPRDLAPTS